MLLFTLLLALSGIAVAESPGTRFGAAVAVVGRWESATPWAVAVGAPGRLEMPGTVWLLPIDGGRRIWKVDGLVAGSGFGFAIEATGDLDGDGFTDLLVGAPEEKARGAVHVISGRTGERLLAVHGNSPGDRFGHSLAWDASLATWIVGAPQTRAPRFEPSSGYVRIYAGLEAAASRELSGPSAGSGFGFSLAAADAGQRGSILAVGAPFYSQGDVDRVGAVNFYSLSANTPEDRITGDTSGMQFGYALELLGRLDGDGQDLVIASSFGKFSDHRPSAVSLVRLHDLEIVWTAVASDSERALGAAMASLSYQGRSGREIRLFVSSPAGGRAQQCGTHRGEAGALIELQAGSGARKSSLQPLDALCQHNLGGNYDHGPLPFAASLATVGDSRLLIGSPDNFGSGEVWLYSPAEQRILMRWSEWAILGQEAHF